MSVAVYASLGFLVGWGSQGSPSDISCQSSHARFKPFYVTKASTVRPVVIRFCIRRSSFSQVSLHSRRSIREMKRIRLVLYNKLGKIISMIFFPGEHSVLEAKFYEQGVYSLVVVE
jgi:hypothetical protein